MITRVFAIFSLLAVTLSSCMKHASDYVPGYGEALNTWAFKDGNISFYGTFQSNPVLHTTPQSNNTYTLEMTGTERATGDILTLVLSLSDPDFKGRSYMSGVSGSDHSDAFYYSGSAASRNEIYSSTNNRPGAIMNYQIRHYDSTQSLAMITFNGQVFDAAGNIVNISKGKLTARIDQQ